MKVWLFRIIALCIPILFFVILEYSLRLANYGQSYPLFIENPADTAYKLPRPDIVKRYFPRNGDVPSVSIEANFFRAQKPQNGIRFVVQGGSTAAGFPYGFGASIAGMLDPRLKQTFPNHYVETVNTSLAAVNSYTNLDMVDEIIEQQPDAVLIYMGHNEFLGILGVGSNYTAANSRSSTLLFLTLKNLRIFQLMQNIYHDVKHTDRDETSNSQQGHSNTFMAKVAKHKSIPFESDLYHAGLDQFSGNLDLILEKYRWANIPVFISTLTSNLLDQAPFSSAPMPENIRLSLEQLIESIKQGKQVQQRLLQVSKTVEESQNAFANFQLGRIFYSLNDAKNAKKHLLLAKDHDLLRFRAPEAINKIILAKALKYDAVIIDAQKRFELRSKHGIVGNNLMLEHLHPNVEGYFLLSDAFYQGIKNAKIFSEWQNVEPQQAWQQKLLLPAEEYFGFAKILQLKTDFPFVKNRTQLTLPAPQNWEQQLGLDLFEKKNDWLNMVQKSQQGYMNENNIQQLLKTQLIIADALPYNFEANNKAAELLETLGQKKRASTYHQRQKWALQN
ncbi:hypothetical protein GLIP_1669 [Aliiglaciecola lipolytica E3]|uniref:SGNH hydrolase-type esterase domain-containing protein n=1 Tax=Aliiglaciecola lipolytica E3 TaxID=1127673 RepID=K6Y7Y6_9ALTE|nr:hypothetical protein GLIP_1669 [Aliiglaciecola lipolytica E3]